MKTRIDIIRHGEPVGGRRYRGYGVDDVLTETGWQQMWAAIPQHPQWNIIISSPMARCAQFAATLAARMQVSHVVIDAMKEVGFGEWEGKTPDEIIASDAAALERFTADPIRNRPAGAEPLDEFSARVWRAYNDIAALHAGKRVLVVAHAGVARAIIANVLRMSLEDVYSRLKVEYGAVVSTLIEKPGGKPKLLVANGL